MNEVMLFPLTSVVLPEGKMKLRIFEPRYKRMVKECSLNNVGFGLCLVENTTASDKQSKIATVGTLVQIVDFEQLSDGLLGITVVGIKRFSVVRMWTESDGLRKAQVDWMENWSLPKDVPDFSGLSEHLAEIHNSLSQFNELYSHRFYDDPNWVTQRWLELLPLDCASFEHLAGGSHCITALNFLNHAMGYRKTI